MKKTFLCLLVLFSFCACTVSYAKNEEPIQSTQGIEIDQNIEKSKEPQDVKFEQKQKKNRSKIYLKKKKQLAKQEYKKKKELKELEYLEKRLENKKLKLDSITSDQVKGENE
jgi:hypothetical protein